MFCVSRSGPLLSSSMPSSSVTLRGSSRLLNVLWIYERVKSILFIYILLTQSIKVHRHLKVTGVSSTARGIYRWVSQRVISLFLHLPVVQKKVQQEMTKAKLDIEAKLVPKGIGVTRHLALPAKGQRSEWILAEMHKMDGELANNSGKSVDWREGKISGAIYRAFGLYSLSRLHISCLNQTAAKSCWM
jgi:sphinganine-1-phosphate aldolase